MAKVRINSEKLTPFGGFLDHGAFIHSFGFYYGVMSYILCGIELCSVYICHDFVGADIESFVYFPLG